MGSAHSSPWAPGPLSAVTPSSRGSCSGGCQRLAGRGSQAVRTAVAAMGTWFPVLGPGVTCPLPDGGPVWCHLPSRSLLSSDFTSAQPLLSASYLPVTPWRRHLCWWMPGAAIFIFCRPCCPGPIVAQEGAVLWAGVAAEPTGQGKAAGQLAFRPLRRDTYFR